MHTEYREMKTRHIPKYWLCFFFFCFYHESPVPSAVEQLYAQVD